MKKWPDDVVNRLKCWYDHRENRCGETHVNCRDCPFYVPGYSMEDAVKDAIGWFYRFETAKDINVPTNQPKWISVEDELPPVGEKVLVNANNVRLIAFIDCEDVWHRGTITFRLPGKVTHWMPLPEPPKEET